MKLGFPRDSEGLRAVSSVGRASRLHRETKPLFAYAQTTRLRTERDSMANEVELADHLRTTSRFDHATTLPRKASLSDADACVMYFIAGAGLIKIGITTNLQSRFRAIRNSSPVPLELLATMTGCTLLEGRAHDKFAHLRRHGEWFEDDGSIREYILAFTGRTDRRLRIPLGSSLTKGGE